MRKFCLIQPRSARRLGRHWARSLSIFFVLALHLAQPGFAGAVEVDEVVGVWNLSISNLGTTQRAKLEIREEQGKLQGEISSLLGKCKLSNVRFDESGLAVDYEITIEDDIEVVHIRLRPDGEKLTGSVFTSLRDDASKTLITAERAGSESEGKLRSQNDSLSGSPSREATRLPSKEGQDFLGFWMLSIGMLDAENTRKMKMGLIVADVDGEIVVAIKTGDGVQRTIYDVSKIDGGLRWTYDMNFGMVIPAHMDLVQNGDEFRVTVTPPQQEVFLAGSAVRVDDASQLGMDEEQLNLDSNLEHIGSFPKGTRVVQTDGELVWLQRGRRLLAVQATNPLLIELERGYFPERRSIVGLNRNRASVVNWESKTLEVYDISESDSTTPLGFCEIPAERLESFIGDKSLVLVVESSGEKSNHRVHAMDASDRLGPVRLGSSEPVFGAQIQDVKVLNSQLFVATRSGLSIFDLTNPKSLETLGRIDVGIGASRGVDVVGTTAYVAKSMHSDASWLQLIDVSDPTAPKQLAEFKTGGGAQDVVVSGSIAFVADRGNGMVLINISDPNNLKQCGYWRTEGLATRVDVAGKLVFVVVYDDHHSLEILRFKG